MQSTIASMLASRGYGYGSGHLDANCKRFLVSIPKNASSYIADWAMHYGWSSAIVGDKCNWGNVEEMIVILRDPVERWISGVAQYITSYILNVTGAYSTVTGPGILHQSLNSDEFIRQYNVIFERLLFDQISRLDDHVWPQHDFFEELIPQVERKYFFVNDNLTSNMANYLKFQPIENLNTNKGTDNLETYNVQKFIQQRLIERQELVDRVKLAYSKDYSLIQSVNFITYD